MAKTSSQNDPDVSKKRTFNREKLGAFCSPKTTIFHFWVKDAQAVSISLTSREEGPAERTLDLYPLADNYWYLQLDEDLHGTYYWLEINREGRIYKAVDPWAKAVSTNSQRAIVVDTSRTDPEGWQEDSRPDCDRAVDAVIYEVHVRDFSSHPQSGMENRRQYLAFTEGGTTNSTGLSTGLDHLEELGITHVQLMPIYDFATVDDTDPEDYNWGYDPYCYNSPEGSYASNPEDLSRITELKQLIMALHDRGIGVIMDVVFNHTYHTRHSPMNLIAPGYFYRWETEYEVANGSGVGNEVATEREKVRDFILQSVTYWAEEYHIDGFRFDLMGLIDRETMFEVRDRLDEIDESMLVYGEPWYALSPNIPEKRLMVKGAQRGRRIGVFNDEFREAIKGDNDGPVPGFITGREGLEHEIKKGAVGHIPYRESLMGLADEPGESINYVSCHDNLTLWDKLKKTCPERREEVLVQLHRFAHAIIFTSQGVAFMHGGAEFLRTKYGDHNSYKSGDRVNALKWNRKTRYQETFEYIRGLIELRREHPALRLPDSQAIRENLEFLDTPEKTAAFKLGPHAGGDSWAEILIIYNGNWDWTKIGLGERKKRHVVVDESQAGLETIRSFQDVEVELSPHSAMVMHCETVR
ncbi:type I pullulanase [Halarsenatibacter silvermanii]|uniref:Pullulanase n=1 Tax=Halarsenatibacter silvermanii TaxID=321763 RepID=A0A1G9H3W0_9FIRM|nr:type I pullulanase [Halarsenatibacter silvermanii]SDL07183.1 pullulanase [Halarsenatibacter silvermanii]